MDLSPGVPQRERHFLGQPQCFSRRPFHMFRPTQPDVDERRAIAEGKPGRVGMVELASPTQIVLDRSRGLIGKTEMPEVPGLVVQSRSTRIVAKAMARDRDGSFHRSYRETFGRSRVTLRNGPRRSFRGQACGARQGVDHCRVAFRQARQSAGRVLPNPWRLCVVLPTARISPGVAAKHPPICPPAPMHARMPSSLQAPGYPWLAIRA